MSDTNKAPLQGIEIVQQQQIALRRQIDRIDDQIKALLKQKDDFRDKITRLKEIELQATGKIKPLDDRSITARNIQFNTAWMAIQNGLIDAGEKGALLKLLKDRVDSALMGVNPSTFRSYIHRLKGMNRIIKLTSGRWILADENKQKVNREGEGR